ncbi:MAG: ATP-binding protein, partial [Hyphomicrobiaceae bacterium]
ERWDSKVAGSGLGLAIARDLARLYGGNVVLDESPLRGLRVSLTLPAARFRMSDLRRDDAMSR